MRIGLIADTHNLLDQRVAQRFAGVDHILHGGDVCRPVVIAELEAIAPVTVVAGNNDTYPGWRDIEVAEFEGYRILLQHIVRPGEPDPAFQRSVDRIQPRMVLFGHTHRTYHGTHDGILFVNPGSAGSPRFGLPRSVAILRLDNGGATVGFLDLDGRPLNP
jgi:putative phosphoesterase